MFSGRGCDRVCDTLANGKNVLPVDVLKERHEPGNSTWPTMSQKKAHSKTFV